MRYLVIKLSFFFFFCFQYLLYLGCIYAQEAEKANTSTSETITPTNDQGNTNSSNDTKPEKNTGKSESSSESNTAAEKESVKEETAVESEEQPGQKTNNKGANTTPPAGQTTGTDAATTGSNGNTETRVGEKVSEKDPIIKPEQPSKPVETTTTQPPAAKKELKKPTTATATTSTQSNSSSFLKNIYIGFGAASILPFANFLKPGFGIELFIEAPVWRTVFVGAFFGAAQHAIKEYSLTGSSSTSTTIALSFAEGSSVSMFAYGIHSTYFYSINRKMTAGMGLVAGFRSLSNKSFSLGSSFVFGFKADYWYNLRRFIDIGLNVLYSFSSTDSVSQDSENITFDKSEATSGLRFMFQARYKIF